MNSKSLMKLVGAVAGGAGLVGVAQATDLDTAFDYSKLTAAIDEVAQTSVDIEVPTVPGLTLAAFDEKAVGQPGTKGSSSSSGGLGGSSGGASAY